jgi:hypothetical protein
MPSSTAPKLNAIRIRIGFQRQPMALARGHQAGVCNRAMRGADDSERISATTQPSFEARDAKVAAGIGKRRFSTLDLAEDHRASSLLEGMPCAKRRSTAGAMKFGSVFDLVWEPDRWAATMVTSERVDAAECSHATLRFQALQDVAV